MTQVFLDATTLFSRDPIGELVLFTRLDSFLVVLSVAGSAVTTEPARTNLERLLETPDQRFRGGASGLKE